MTEPTSLSHPRAPSARAAKGPANPFASNTNPSTRLHGLDTLRALAILLVLPFHLHDHLPAALQQPARFGWIGVDLFFVLSGFLIGSQLFRPSLQGRPLSLSTFYRRRAYRILPAFWAVLLLYVAVPAWREAPGMQPWWQFLTFTENFLIDYRHNQAFSHAWSLCVEEHFYLLVPLLTLLLLRRPAAWKTCTLLTVVFLAGILLRTWVLLHVLRPLGPDADGFGLTFTERLYYPTYTRLDGLLDGVALALLRTFRPAAWQKLRRHGHILTLAALLCLSAALWTSTQRAESVYGVGAFFDVFGYPLLALGFVLLVTSAVSQNGLLARVRVPGATLLSTLAFSLYLTHKEALHLLFRIWPHLPDSTWETLPPLSVACLLVAAVLYLAVERPFLLLRDRQRVLLIPHASDAGDLTASHLDGAKGAGDRVDREARLDPAL